MGRLRSGLMIMNGREIWQAAEDGAAFAGVPATNGLRFCALSRMLMEAEKNLAYGDRAMAVEQLRELQAHCEKLIGMLAPLERAGPRLVA